MHNPLLRSPLIVLHRLMEACLNCIGQEFFVQGSVSSVFRRQTTEAKAKQAERARGEVGSRGLNSLHNKTTMISRLTFSSKRRQKKRHDNLPNTYIFLKINIFLSQLQKMNEEQRLIVNDVMLKNRLEPNTPLHVSWRCRGLAKLLQPC